MSEEKHDEHEDVEGQEYEVVELEAEDGEREEFVIIEEVKAGDKTYAIMALLADVRDMEDMDEETFNEAHSDDEPIFTIMRRDNDAFTELSEEEFEGIRDTIEAKLAELAEEADED